MITTAVHHIIAITIAKDTSHHITSGGILNIKIFQLSDCITYMAVQQQRRPHTLLSDLPLFFYTSSREKRGWLSEEKAVPTTASEVVGIKK